MPKKYGTPGPRMIFPSVATSLRLGRCSMQAQLLFDRLIVAADDQGRLPGDPALLRAACFPLVPKATPRAIERWLAELVGAGLVMSYEVHGEALLQIRNWWDHQDGQRNAYSSRWPAPEGYGGDRLKGHGADPEHGGQPGADGGHGGPNVPFAVPRRVVSGHAGSGPDADDGSADLTKGAPSSLLAAAIEAIARHESGEKPLAPEAEAAMRRTVQRHQGGESVVNADPSSQGSGQ